MAWMYLPLLCVFCMLSGCGARSTLEEPAPRSEEQEECSAKKSTEFAVLPAMDLRLAPGIDDVVVLPDEAGFVAAGIGVLDVGRCDDARISGTGDYFIAGLSTSLQLRWEVRFGLPFRSEALQLVQSGDRILALIPGSNDVAGGTWSLLSLGSDGNLLAVEGDARLVGFRKFCASDSGHVLVLGEGSAVRQGRDALSWYSPELSQIGFAVAEGEDEGDLAHLLGCVFQGDEAVVFGIGRGRISVRGELVQLSEEARAFALRFDALGAVAGVQRYGFKPTTIAVEASPSRGAIAFAAEYSKEGEFGQFHLPKVVSGAIVAQLSEGLDPNWVVVVEGGYPHELTSVSADPSGGASISVSFPHTLAEQSAPTIGDVAVSEGNVAVFLDSRGAVTSLVADPMAITVAMQLQTGERLLTGRYDLANLTKLPGAWPAPSANKPTLGLLSILDAP